MVKVELSKIGSRKFLYYILFFLFLVSTSCHRGHTATTAFYYWKSGFELTAAQQNIMQDTAKPKLYVRFFDINWNEKTKRAYPEAIVQFHQSTERFHITPVVYIRNKTFENLALKDIDSLAMHCNGLVHHIAKDQGINYSNLQLDCDWTLETKNKYFRFLLLLKKMSGRKLEATIRLHQVKYRQQTGVPPVDTGILMFYNMGKLNANLQQANSIYNQGDAAKYVAYLKMYPLPLDVALPVFSWSVQIRDGKAIQVYGLLTKNILENRVNFELIRNDNIYRSKRNYFLKGVYIKQNDIFKLEEITAKTLAEAAKQLSEHLPEQQKRTIIYYELANLDLSAFKAATLSEISADF